MTHEHLEEFSDLEFDVLKELSNIGAGNATTAISTMMNLKVNMNIPVIKFLEFKELAGVIGGEENIVVGILLGLQSDLDGMMMFLMDRKSAIGVINKILTMNGAPAMAEDADFDVAEYDDSDLDIVSSQGGVIIDGDKSETENSKSKHKFKKAADISSIISDT